MSNGPAALTRALGRLAARLRAGEGPGLVLVCGPSDPMLPGPAAARPARHPAGRRTRS